MEEASPKSIFADRIRSIDFFRGVTMLLLIAEFTALFSWMTDPSLAGSWLYLIGRQFHHHPWHGLHFWDLIQPFFMFIVGVAMPFAIARREERGQSRSAIRKHVLKRAFLLLLLGWALYCIGSGRIVFRFQNVLAQLSVTYLLAYLVMRRPVWFQLGFSIFLLVLTEVLYRTFWIDGFAQPFVANQNFGTWLDMQYGGADLDGSWVSFNAIPTTAHTIWGVLTGQLLQRNTSHIYKLKVLLAFAFIAIIVGHGLDGITPIIKRISTSSFVIASGGWSIFAMAVSYYLIDVKKWRKGTLFFVIVGMNPLFIYLFSHVGGADFLKNLTIPFMHALLGWTGMPYFEISVSLVTLFLLWYLTYWLFRRNIFIKL